MDMHQVENLTQKIKFTRMNQGRSNKQIQDALLFTSIGFIGALITLIVSIFV